MSSPLPRPPQKPDVQPTRQVPRRALSKAEAAEALGVSVDFLEEHVMHELRIVRRGRRRLIPIAELQGWLDRSAARPLGP
jgi:excisionase family DNA binding protein